MSIDPGARSSTASQTFRTNGPNGIAALGVVLPARNEAGTIGAAITAIGRSAAAAGEPAWRLVVVLDRCTDHSAAAAESAVEALDLASADHVEVVDAVAGNAGRARHIGVERIADHFALGPEAVWVATTDADSVVGPGWVATHRAAAAAGAALLAGAVAVTDWSEWSPGVSAAHDRQHRLSGAHGPRPVAVYGANLGVRLDAYWAAGGFAPVSVGEDQALFDAVAALGLPVAVSDTDPVVTSARRRARAHDGFAGYLRRVESRLGGDVAI